MWMKLFAGGLAASALGLSILVGRDGGKPPLTQVERDAKAAADLPKTLLQQALMRIAMHKKALSDEDMKRAIGNAVALQMPKTMATLASIAKDGKPGGPNYVGLPIDEMWPGTQVSVRQYITNAMAALSSQVTA